ncbi:hypothetical protein PybrP1_003691 [[Pythium] brassicae (nom. inval.)]|nr:hypothetical protein PybrP1_003691 [[Pythium] brassicae (nom. inval.)]
MNNLFSSAIFSGQKLRVRRKQRSQSLPVLPFADKMEQENDDGDARHQQQQQQEEDEAEEEEDQQPETSPRSEHAKRFHPPRKSASFHPEDAGDAPVAAAAAKRNQRQQRSKSARLPTHLEDDDFVLPRLLGGSATEVLSDSRLGAKLVPKLEASLSTRFRGYDWQLLYSLAQHGASVHTLLRNARGKSPTLVVVETTRGDVFGGFAAVPWAKSTSYYGNGESFVFTCQPRYERFPWTHKNTMFMLSTDQSIGMGGGGGFAWFANADLSRGSSAPSDTFLNRRLASESDFEIAGVEVWGFVTKR